ncbi:MAG: peptidoglycan editing factor PgeF [Dokdonella sp.]
MSSAAIEPWLVPDWPAPARVQARITTRQTPGVSKPPFDRCNLGNRCGDDGDAVSANRASLVQTLNLPSDPLWMRQVHGTSVIDADDACLALEPEGDAALTRADDVVLAVLSADCLPVLFCTQDGHAIAVAHAGWRGLAAGILESTIERLDADPARVLAWLGPSIGAASYEIGEEVRQAFVDVDPGAAHVFAATRPGHWQCDLPGLARRRLATVGITHVSGGNFDTRGDVRFFSYRENPQSGRFASLIWRSKT